MDKLFQPKNLEQTFSGHKILVSGGTRGIGRAISIAFLHSGATVIATYAQNEKAALQFKDEMEAQINLSCTSTSATPPTIDIQKCDVTKSSEVDRLYSYIEEKYSSLEVLVNNAGIRQDSIVGTMTIEQWNAVIDTNLTGTFLMSKKAILLFLSARYGRIINIGSIGGQLGLPGQANYSATKAALLGFTKSLSKEVARKGITINCVEPGFIETDFVSGLPPEQIDHYQKLIPLKRFGRPEEVAHAVLFLAHKKASYITGTSLAVSGGL